LPGTKLGKGCVVGAGSVVKGVFSDYAIVVGNPAKVVGDTRTVDQKLYADGLDFSNYYDKSLIQNNRIKTV
jgi:acetyltransferase-like isoleucine patch superfamily enzyme